MDNVITAIQRNRLWWYGRVKKGREWLSEKCIDYKVEGVRRRSIPKKTWKRDCGKTVGPNT